MINLAIRFVISVNIIYVAADLWWLGVGKGMVSKDAIYTTMTAYNNACANMRSEARDNLISIYIDDGEEAKLYLWQKLIIQTPMHFLSVNYCRTGKELPSHLNPI